MPAVGDRAARLSIEVVSSSKWRHMSRDFVTRLCGQEAAEGRSDKDIVKRVKRKLHQVGGAYFRGAPRYARWLDDLREAQAGQGRLNVIENILERHTSQHERMVRLTDYYAALFDGVGHVDRVLDLACGFNPLARPWMPIAPSRYLATDVYSDLVAFLAEAGTLTGFPVEAFIHDLTTGPPDAAADVALLLKAVPCLDQIDPGTSARLLAALRAPTVLVTFPVRSLGGREKGMRSQYSDRLHDIVGPLNYAVAPLELPSELGFKLSRRP